jgi:hypothetical protein
VAVTSIRDVKGPRRGVCSLHQVCPFVLSCRTRLACLTQGATVGFCIQYWKKTEPSSVNEPVFLSGERRKSANKEEKAVIRIGPDYQAVVSGLCSCPT